MNLDTILDAPADKPSKFEYAGFWIRLAAYLIDGVILWIVNAGLNFLLLRNDPSPEYAIGLLILSFTIGVIYFCLMESSQRQGTLGKLAVGIKVGDAFGDRISFGTALGRYFSKILSALFLFIGFMMAGWDPKKQALHDKIMNTYVTYGKAIV